VKTTAKKYKNCREQKSIASCLGGNGGGDAGQQLDGNVALRSRSTYREDSLDSQLKLLLACRAPSRAARKSGNACHRILSPAPRFVPPPQDLPAEQLAHTSPKRERGHRKAFLAVALGRGGRFPEEQSTLRICDELAN
jgi:hypothetical protein